MADTKVKPTNTSQDTNEPKVDVEDAEKRQLEDNDTGERQRADQLEKALNSPAGGPEVTVNTPQEIRKNQESAAADYRKEERARTNAGLDSPDRPGGPDGNGRQYKDERIMPQDTNAPDAGLLPDGTRVAY